MDGLSKTFELLGHTKNEAALDVLTPALNAPETAIQDGALLALIERRDIHSQREILRRVPTMPVKWLKLLESRRGSLSKATRDAIFGADREQCSRVCDVVALLRDYDSMTPLVTALAEGPCHFPDVIARTMTQLAELLHDELRSPRDYSHRRDPHKCRRDMLAQLERAVGAFSVHGRSEVIEAFLLVAYREHPLLRQLIGDKNAVGHELAVTMLSKATRPGIVRLLLEFLEEQQPNQAALDIIARRDDHTYVTMLLDKIGQTSSPLAMLNLKRVASIAWINPDQGVLADLSGQAQASAVTVIMAAGVKRDAAFNAIVWLLRHGKPEGRQAAAEALAHFQGNAANELAHEASLDSDSLVRAAGLRQIRDRGIPGALARLIEAVDHEHESVRQAARDSLPEFRTKRFFSGFEAMTESVRETTGRLVYKIDPHAQTTLREEFASPSNTLRLRAVHVAMAMGAASAVAEELRELLLRDADFSVRAAAAQALRDDHSSETREALRNAMSDASHAVQQAASDSLALLEQPLPVLKAELTSLDSPVDEVMP